VILIIEFRERCSLEELSLILKYCAPITTLDFLGTVLKNALWGPELYLTEVDNKLTIVF
jgi:hypothetical protein